MKPQPEPQRIFVADNPAPDFVVVVPEGCEHFEEFERRFAAAFAEDREEPSIVTGGELEERLRAQP
jgi:hypothetical protein